MRPAEAEGTLLRFRIDEAAAGNRLFVRWCVGRAFAQDFRGDALRDLAHHTPVAVQKRPARVALHIDEARRNDLPTDVNPLVGLGPVKQPSGHDGYDTVAP